MNSSNWFLVGIIIFLSSKTSCISNEDKFKMDIRVDKSNLNDRIIYPSDSFNNIPLVISRREAIRNNSEAKYSQLCARGVWFLYENAHFVANDNKLNGVSLYSTTKHLCISLDEIGTLGSAQSVTGLVYNDPHITFFPYTNFIGIAMPVFTKPHRSLKPASTPPTRTDIVNSFITIGKSHWTVIFTDGTKICVIPKESSDSICFLTNLVTTARIAPASGVEKVRKHCRKNKNETGVIIQLTDCMDLGKGLVPLMKLNPTKPVENATSSTTTQKPNIDNENQSGCEAGDSADVLTPEHMKLIRARLNSTMGSGYWIFESGGPRNIWKTEIFEKVFKIFSSACHQEVIHREYLELFSLIYLYHWDKSWEETNGSSNSSVQFSEDEWMAINHNLNECYDYVSVNSYPQVLKALTMLRSYKSISDLLDVIDESLGVRPDYDPVMEINWIMANVVADLCFEALNKDADFVLRFWNVYHPLYFTPIEKQWVKPGDISLAYKRVFGGFGMAKSFAKIGICAINLMLDASPVRPYKRPMEQKLSILLPSRSRI